MFPVTTRDKGTVTPVAVVQEAMVVAPISQTVNH